MAQAEIGSVIQRAGEVNLKKLDGDSQNQMRLAMTGEIKAWLKYHATKAALRANYAEKDIMKMRWVLRFRDSGQANARLVIIGYQDPRIGGEVRTEAPVISRRGRSLFLTKVAQRRFHIRKGDVKNAFLQGRGAEDADEELELAADPVPELAEHMGLGPDEIVILTKLCYGLIDAPRQWWITLRTDLEAQNWRRCKLEPCLLTLWSGQRTVGILCYHVDDIMIAGNEKDPVYIDALTKLRETYEWGSWEDGEFEICGYH